jgi:hypothetical protein
MIIINHQIIKKLANYGGDIAHTTFQQNSKNHRVFQNSNIFFLLWALVKDSRNVKCPL